MTLDDVIDRIITIYRANHFLGESIKNMYLAHKRDVDGPAGERLETDKMPELQELVNKPMAELAKKYKRAHSSLWLRLHSLLKPAWDKGDYLSSELYSGSLFDLKTLRRTFESRVAIVDRLPQKNSLPELNALREAWNDVDRYELHAASAKTMRRIIFSMQDL